MNDQTLITEGQLTIAKGSKSFALASLFFKEEQRMGAWLLYSWCRYCDDQIDQSPTEQSMHRLAELRKLTEACYQDSSTELPLPFQSLKKVVGLFKIPQKYPMDLLRGMQMDIEGAKIQTEEDLLDYCYCVAGTVGLMMSHVMGVSDNKALTHAVAMGNAMQLTNICRDVAEDLSLGRIYFPRTWLAEIGLTENQFSQQQSQWPKLSERALLLADKNYQLGKHGLSYLSLRAAFAVCVASDVYRGIGTKVRKCGIHAWDSRTFTTHSEKYVLVVKSLLTLALTLPKRFLKPWKSVPITQIWSHK